MRSRETVRMELEETRRRLKLYLAREEQMLSPEGVQMYTIGSRNLQRYQTALADIQAMIEKLRKREKELEAELNGSRPRRAVGAVPFDW